IASIRDKPVAVALILSWNRHLIYKFGASDSGHWKLGANFLVHWTAMEWGCVNGYLDYDFGRTDSRHESLREFKAAWGGSELAISRAAAVLPAEAWREGDQVDSILAQTLGEGQFGPGHWRLGRASEVYYALKPVLPRSLTRRLKGWYGAHRAGAGRLGWPIE